MKRKKERDFRCVKVRMPIENLLEAIQSNFREKLENVWDDSKEVEILGNLLKGVIGKILSNKFVIGGKVELTQMPLGSENVSGKYRDREAGMLVYVPGNSRKRAYTRRWIIPHNPRTQRQQAQRDLFRQAVRHWGEETNKNRQLWEEEARANRPLSGRNLYIRKWFEAGKRDGRYPGVDFRPEVGQ